jgi:hypothetical protein
MNLPSVQRFFTSAILLLAAFCSSCKKDVCQGNCTPIRLTGKVIDSSNNRGVAYVPIRVYWQMAGICYVCPELKVGSSLTDMSGNFDFTVPADRSRFGDYALRIELAIPDKYLLGRLDEEHRFRCSFYRYDPNEFQNLRFVVYSKTTLTIRLQRTQTDNFKRLVVYHGYSAWYNTVYDSELQPTVPPEGFTVTTGANVYTKVMWQMWSDRVMVPSAPDSVFCAPNRANTVVVPY